MLDPAWAFTPLVLWIALLALIALLVVRTIRRDRKEYQRFKRYRTTARRQKMMRRWLLDSFVSFGGLSVVILLLAGAHVVPLLQELFAWPVVRDIRGWFIHSPGVAWGVVVGLAIGFVVVTLIGLRAARTEQEVPTIGDIQAMLPRNKQELLLGGVMSVNAGVVEELMFRLALPALIFGASGSAIAAVFGSVILFGVLHLYQGPVGVIGTGVIGAIFMLVYAVSGTIALPILLHALFDLRSMVLIPVAVYGVHRIDGRVTRVIAPRQRPVGAPAVAASTPASASAAASASDAASASAAPDATAAAIPAGPGSTAPAAALTPPAAPVTPTPGPSDAAPHPAE